jgi:hypothetical protein
MRKKTFIAIVTVALILVSLVEMQTVEIGKANPVPFPPTPNKETPSLAIVNPQNYSTVNASSFLLNFTVTKPNSWNSVYIFFYIGQIISIDVILDGNLRSQMDMRGNNATSFSVLLNQLTSGLHEANVTVLSYTYYTQVFLDRPNIYSNITDNDRPIYAYPIVVSDTVFFTVDASVPSSSPPATPSPTPSPSPVPTSTLALTASLSESASALNFGNTINFTVSVEGGNAPFTYAWYIDGELVENGTSPYYATDSQAVGSHHVYVEVKDADNNTAKTLSPEFNVLPSLTYMPSSSSSPTQQPTIEPSPTASPTPVAESSNLSLVLEIAAVIVIVAIVIVGLLVYFRKRRG